jgi:hypothetical protein
MKKNNPTHIQTFEEFTKTFEGDGTFKMKTRASSDGRERLDDLSDETTAVVKNAKEQVSACVEILENLLTTFEKVEITKKPIENCLGELKTYLAGLDSATKTLSQSNTLKQ